MIIPVISDIHGNPNFYEAVKDSEFIICLGDYVGASGENPDSNRCIDICKTMKGHFLIGNHDIEALQDVDKEYEITFVKEGIEYSSDFGISEENKNWLRKTRKWFKTQIGKRNFLFIHSYLKENYFCYLDDEEIIFEFMETIKDQDSIVFIGHTHAPGVYSLNRDGVLTQKQISYGEWILFGGDGKYLVNVGSTGDPRDGKKTGTYVLFDTGEMAIKFCEVRSRE